MISSIRGEVFDVREGVVEVEVQGLGYQLFVPTGFASTLKRGQSIRIATQLVVREDSMTLFGFESADQRDLFNKLNQVNGVGPRLALAVLSSLTPERLRSVVASQDVDALVSVPGIGKRGAQRIVLDLKDKLGVSSVATIAPTSKIGEVREALIALGYTSVEAREVIHGLSENDDLSVEEMVKSALKELSRV